MLLEKLNLSVQMMIRATQMVMPGDRIKMIVELIQPIAIEKGMRFAIREGGRTVGAGVVSTILYKYFFNLNNFSIIFSNSLLLEKNSK